MIVKQGIVDRQAMAQYYDVPDFEEEDDSQGVWDISLLSRLLFLSVRDALNSSEINTRKQEQRLMREIANLHSAVKENRDLLDSFDKQRMNRNSPVLCCFLFIFFIFFIFTFYWWLKRIANFTGIRT